MRLKLIYIEVYYCFVRCGGDWDQMKETIFDNGQSWTTPMGF